MALRTAIGSAPWIAAEKENVEVLLSQEKEELAFPAQHEMEWLNEHMLGVFSKGQVEVTTIFKTPGKLRGKTPRTVRKRNQGEQRIPLSDIFSSKPIEPSDPPRGKVDYLQTSSFKDDSVHHQVTKSQADSGYHGSSQMDEDVQIPTVPLRSPLRRPQSPVQEEDEEDKVEEEKEEKEEKDPRTTEGSFHSAKEDQTAKLPRPAQNLDDVEVEMKDALNDPSIVGPAITMQPDFDDVGSPSDESTPDRPLVKKKSSMTFASLPAREPMKTSIGGRMSRTSHVDAVRLPDNNRDSYQSHQRSRSGYEEADHSSDDENNDEEMDDSHLEILGRDDSDVESDFAKQQSKATTQRLHEKLEMLDRTSGPRVSKSIPNLAAISALAPKSEELKQTTPSVTKQAQEEDDWIKPLTASNQGEGTEGPEFPHETTDEEDYDVRAPELIAHEERVNSFRSPSPARPGFGHAKSASTATLRSPAKAAMVPPTSPVKPISVSNPPLSSTTPQGSPKRFMDGTLSASKSKLHSIMRTARGLFTSSAGVSAAAKMETLSPNALRIAAQTMPGLYPNMDKLLEDKPLPTSPPREGRKTRSSTEKEKDEKKKDRNAKAMQKMNDDLERARQKEQEKAAQQHKMAQDRAQEAKVETEDRDPTAEMPPPPQPAKMGRPVRAAAGGSKVKPQPVSIKVGTFSQRMPVNNTQVAPHHQETLQGEPKRPGLTKKTSTTSLSSTSTATFKTSVSSQPTKPRALLAAERKKEQDERDAQRKLEQKREMERKRAMIQEDARKKEQREREDAERKERERIAEQQRKRQAQQDVIEKKRQEASRRAEQQRLERTAAQEVPPSRAPSRLGQQNGNRHLLERPLPTNPAKPAKRPVEEDPTRPQPARFGAASQQADSKRRRTEDEQLEAPPRPTISGAPIRQSQLGKKPSIFNHPAYAPAPGPAHLGQFPQPPNRQHPQMQQFATAKIPFAESSTVSTKTPASNIRAVQPAKSSPHYPNGDAIHLPDIPTDSEDEDSDDEANAFPLPDWATPGHLAAQLMAQEGLDGDAVFGPIAPLKMEEIFPKTTKDRLKRLRDRTSSANWALSGDGLTLEEVRADKEQRERMMREGGWRYGAS